jgi:hypothetical protein
LYRMGNIAFKNQQYQQAATFFEKTIVQLPRNSKAHYNLSITQLVLAEKHLTQYIELSPEDANIDKVNWLVAQLRSFNDGSYQKKAEPLPVPTSAPQETLAPISSEVLPPIGQEAEMQSQNIRVEIHKPKAKKEKNVVKQKPEKKVVKQASKPKSAEPKKAVKSSSKPANKPADDLLQTLAKELMP